MQEETVIQSRTDTPEISLVVAATFAADPIRQPLEFWMKTLELPIEVLLAPYAQVMQELLDPRSSLARNTLGFNVLLLRPEDWIRDRLEQPLERNLAHLDSVAVEFVDALAVLRSRSKAKTIVYLCPRSSSLPEAYCSRVDELRREIGAKLAADADVSCFGHDDLIRLYEVTAYEDLRTERIAHIPYKTDYFVALATLLARRVAAARKPRRKVIAVDCDNTLWGGVCAEDDPAGIVIGPAHLRLQQELIRQHDAGVLLCLCSKNNSADVEAVFAARPDMLLREEHLIAKRVNWSAKSTNLRSLAEELDLSIDSFMLIDDSAAECAEVAAQCPQVLTLQFPQSRAEALHFCDHVWAFDQAEVTAEAKNRTQRYRENRARAKALVETADLQKFLDSLELQVDIAPMQTQHLERVAELTQRTNQFNMTTQRATAGEIELRRQSGRTDLLVVHVRDRFGDYGLVGVVFASTSSHTLMVDTFLLSCRVLGRGVERRVVQALAGLARERGLDSITLKYRRTARNEPARAFLEGAFSDYRVASETLAEAADFVVPLDAASMMMSSSVNHERASIVAAEPTGETATPRSASHGWHETAYALSRVADITQAMQPNAPRATGRSDDYIEPRTPVEITVAQVWAAVLGTPAPGIHDDFFQRGGDSLSAVQVIAGIGAALGLDLSIHAFYSEPTVAAIAANLASAARFAPPLERLERSRPLRLSWTQQRLWFIDQLEGGSRPYHIPLLIRLTGELQTAHLQTALNALIARHESLRTVFESVDGQPMLKIAEPSPLTLKMKNLQQFAADERTKLLVAYAQGELYAAFDLGVGPLIRAALVQLANDVHVLVLTMHHIVSDGWSTRLLFREIGQLYAAARDGLPPPLPPLTFQYADYAHWQRQCMTATEREQQLAYWRDTLRGAPEVLQLPLDRPRPLVSSHRGATVRFSLDAEAGESLREFSRRSNVTLAMTLFAAWSIVLARLSAQSDLVIGMPIANRRRSELEGIVGFFVNTLALRVRVEDDPTVAELLQRVKALMLKAYAHQDTPFERVVETLQPARSLSHSPVFQVMFVMQPSSDGELRLRDLSLAEMELPLLTSQFDLRLSLRESDRGISGDLNYATDIIDAETAERWAGYVQSALRAMVSEPTLCVSGVPLLGQSELRRVLVDFNSPCSGEPQDTLIHELFEEHAARASDRAAIVGAEQTLSYAELNSRANQLAYFLREQGVLPDRRVALCFERCSEMVIGLLAVLKAGGAYVPLDPMHPDERLAEMIDDSGAVVLLADASLAERLRGIDGPDPVVVDLNAWNRSRWANAPGNNLGVEGSGLTAANLAYVIYTSGSTGKPKGVMIEHRSLVNFLRGMEERIHGLEPDCRRIAWNSSFGFDMAAKAWGQLTAGRTVYLIPEDTRLSGEHLLACLESNGIEAIECTPSHLRTWRDAGLEAGRAPALKKIMLGGEAIDAATWSALATARDRTYFNMYGPTECTVDASCGRIEDTRPNIGRTMPNARIYILDARLQPAPIGVSGEIHIGGHGVARGYLNRPELTAERFLHDPFAEDPKARMYRTGDIGRWRADGTIEYGGRNDHQVKIRGFRIELGEIESQLARHPLVRQALVIVREDVAQERRLVAYLTSSQQRIPSGDVLRTHLKTALPEHMIPSAFVVVERIPLNANGKVDRQALPKPAIDDYATQAFEPPQGEIEETVAGVWRTLLRVERVGRHDSFFGLGGHSLLIVAMMERLRRVGLSTELRKVYESPTLADLARSLTNASLARPAAPVNLIPPSCDSIDPAMVTMVELTREQLARVVATVPGGDANIQDIYPLTPLQEGFLFHHLLNGHDGDAYFVPTLLAISSRQRLNEFVCALQRVIDRHDILRTSILWEDLPRPLQVVHRQAKLQVDELELDPLCSAREQVEEWLVPGRNRLDLRRAPLLRLQAARDPHGSAWFVLFQLHHIVADTTSMQIVIDEIVAYLADSTAQLADPAGYRLHVAQALEFAKSNDSAAFFRAKLGDVDEPTAPYGLIDVHGDGSRIDESERWLEESVAVRIRHQAQRLGVSVATIFHAACGLVAAATTGKTDIVIGSVLLGRLQGSAGARRTLGMFINTLPLRLRLSEVSVQGLVHQTQQELIELLAHEQASLSLAQQCSAIAGSAPLFTMLFNFRHAGANPGERWSRASGIEALGFRGTTNYPLTFSVDDLGESFKLTGQTDRRIDSARATMHFATAVESLLVALETTPQAAASSLSIVPPDERTLVLERFNDTRLSAPRDALVHRLFEEQAQRTPQAKALIHGDDSVTYEMLDTRSSQLAGFLRDNGIGPNQLVGICVERSFDMVIGLLGILKAGGAYLPLDPSYPRDRLEYMLKDAGPQLVLTQTALRAVLPHTHTEVVEMDRQWREIAMFGSKPRSIDTDQSTGDLAYVIYTSGSTGLPKGTAMPHRAVANLLDWHRRVLPLQGGERVLQFAALSFDVAFQDTFSTLCLGGTLVLLDEWIRKDARALVELLRDQSVRRVFLPPMMLQTLAECTRGMQVDLQLTDVIVAGEQLRISPEIVDWFGTLRECKLHNHYGPTETHVVTALTLDGCPEEWPALPGIGRPISNTQIYILDAGRKPVPLGVAGEIYIAGSGVAHGYLRRPELTAERFVRNPFSLEPDARMYKTGDLACWQADGTIIYLGRNDDQIKIRGFRIELGEIETQLGLSDVVKEITVVARKDFRGEQRLVAYFTPAAGVQPDIERLRAHARSRLPEHMVPSAFVRLDALPLTPSGKLDRRALPAVELDGAHRDASPPSGEVEEALAQIWQDLLGLTEVGRGDNFFDNGGHSLLAVKAQFRINQQLNCSLRVNDIYKYPTIRELAARIEGSAAEDDFVELALEAHLDPRLVAPADQRRSASILLTGGTGFIGRFLLVELLRDTEATVYCLVRARSEHEARFRLRTTLARWDLWREEFEQRVVAVPGDLRLPNLGIAEHTYGVLSESVGTIFHCGTSMNHLETYAQAKPANVESARELLKLATLGTHKVINYISTVGVFSAFTADHRRVVHEGSPIDDEKHPSSRGYVASKWVAEKVFMNGAARGIACNIFRLGLVWGDAKQGRYDELQRGYRLLKSSLLCGYGIENYRYETWPVPVDDAARAIVALANENSEGLGLFHICSSHPMTEGLFERCNELPGVSLQLLPLYDWIGEVKRLHREGITLPIVPLVQYAFAMDEQAFYDQERQARARAVSIDCMQTQRQLERAGVVPTQAAYAVIDVCVKDMYSRDDQLQHLCDEAESVLANEEAAKLANMRGERY